jgi:hypothetical protein
MTKSDDDKVADLRARGSAVTPESQLTVTDRDKLADLRARGFAVVIFNPSELQGANPRKVEERLVELGWDVIAAL